MENEVIKSSVLEQRRNQRDTARDQRDIAIIERDSARIQRDDSMIRTASLEQNQTAQEQFIATLSHDLRSPIAAIKMAAGLIKDSADHNLKKDMIALIDRNADQAGELISQLLDAHLIRSGAKFPVEMADCEIISVLHKCQQSMAPSEQSQITVISELEEVWGYWDSQAIERAFKNLFSNAMKFSDLRGVVITVVQHADITSIQFQNHGETISIENQYKIFDPLVRVHQAESKHKAGWGLGLTLVKGIAEAHYGKVEVSSNISDGTIFNIQIPNDSRI